MPVASILDVSVVIGRKCDDVRSCRTYLLIAPRAAIGLRRARTGYPANDPLTVGMLLSALRAIRPGTPHGVRRIRLPSVLSPHVRLHHPRRSGVGAKTAAGLAPEVTRGDEVLKARSWSETGLAEL